MTSRMKRVLSALAMFMVMLSVVPSTPPSYAQGACRAFPETGKTVCDAFLTYWNAHGGLAQQGYPITEAAPEKNATDGRVYLTQYFERAVFEQHPEFAPPNDVLLSLLGVFRFQEKYEGSPPPSASPVPPASTPTNVPAPPGPTATATAAPPPPPLPTATNVPAPPPPTATQRPPAPTPTTAPSGQRCGAICNDGTRSNATGSGACSHHGGVREWIYCDIVAAPAEQIGSRTFPETGHTVSGVFLSYWTTHGGLAQQGYPISEVFNETSDTDGQTYKVQYFQRAVFEMHAEFAGTPNEVLLSLLGTFRLHQTLTARTPVATPTSRVQPTNTPVPPAPTSPPAPTAGPCDGIPSPIDMEMQPANGCGPAGTVFLFLGHGFTAGEQVGAYVTLPDQSVSGARFQFTADSDGYAGVAQVTTVPGFPLGIWAISFEGVTSHHKAIGYFKLRP